MFEQWRKNYASWKRKKKLLTNKIENRNSYIAKQPNKLNTQSCFNFLCVVPSKWQCAFKIKLIHYIYLNSIKSRQLISVHKTHKCIKTVEQVISSRFNFNIWKRKSRCSSATILARKSSWTSDSFLCCELSVFYWAVQFHSKFGQTSASISLIRPSLAILTFKRNLDLFRIVSACSSSQTKTLEAF